VVRATGCGNPVRYYLIIMSDKRKYADRREYLIKAVAKRRKRIREKAIKYKGGKCILCGYKKCIATLEFHHISEDDKNFGLSMNGITRSWEKTERELDKCVLLCANCHRELHSGITQLPKEILE